MGSLLIFIGNAIKILLGLGLPFWHSILLAVIERHAKAVCRSIGRKDLKRLFIAFGKGDAVVFVKQFKKLVDVRICQNSAFDRSLVLKAVCKAFGIEKPFVALKANEK